MRNILRIARMIGDQGLVRRVMPHVRMEFDAYEARISCTSEMICFGKKYWTYEPREQAILLEHELHHIDAAHPQRGTLMRRIANHANSAAFQAMLSMCAPHTLDTGIMMVCNAAADLVVNQRFTFEDAEALDMFRAGRAPFGWLPLGFHGATMEGIVWSIIAQLTDSPAVQRMPIVQRFGREMPIPQEFREQLLFYFRSCNMEHLHVRLDDSDMIMDMGDAGGMEEDLHYPMG